MTTHANLIAFAFAAVLVMTSAAGCDGDDGAAPATPLKAATPASVPATANTANAANGATITIADNSFTPGSVTVARGSTVTWMWSGRNPHSVAGGEFKSDTKTGSGKFEFTFGKTGTFDYQCGVHGAAMPGKIIVQ